MNIIRKPSLETHWRHRMERKQPFQVRVLSIPWLLQGQFPLLNIYFFQRIWLNAQFIANLKWGINFIQIVIMWINLLYHKCRHLHHSALALNKWRNALNEMKIRKIKHKTKFPRNEEMRRLSKATRSTERARTRSPDATRAARHQGNAPAMTVTRCRNGLLTKCLFIVSLSKFITKRII